MVKYAFGFPVVAMVSHIPVKSRTPVNYVTAGAWGFLWVAVCMVRQFSSVFYGVVSATLL